MTHHGSPSSNNLTSSQRHFWQRLSDKARKLRLDYLEWPITRWPPQVDETHNNDCVAKECPVALVYNGISHAVMMATPSELDHLARGFSLTEGIVPSLEHIYGIDVHQHDGGEIESYTVELEIS